MNRLEIQDRTIASPKTIRFTECRLPGCYLVEFPNFRDHRGLFVKSFQRSAFEERGWSATSRSRSIPSLGERAAWMHFQAPPADHAKLVYCLSGAIYDMALDLRVGSPTFGSMRPMISARNTTMRRICRGNGTRILRAVRPGAGCIQVTSEHSPAHDTGIRWNSFGAEWPQSAPVVSLRDESLALFLSFESPFRFDPELTPKRNSIR